MLVVSWFVYVAAAMQVWRFEHVKSVFKMPPASRYSGA